MDGRVVFVRLVVSRQQIHRAGPITAHQVRMVTKFGYLHLLGYQ